MPKSTKSGEARVQEILDQTTTIEKMSQNKKKNTKTKTKHSKERDHKAMKDDTKHKEI